MPRKPETHAKLKDVLAAERGFPLPAGWTNLPPSAEARDYACRAYRPPRQA